MLKSIKVEKLVISAIPGLVETWTEGFGFEPLEDYEKQSLRNINLMVFPGTVWLKKLLFVRHKLDQKANKIGSFLMISCFNLCSQFVKQLIMSLWKADDSTAIGGACFIGGPSTENPKDAGYEELPTGTDYKNKYLQNQEPDTGVCSRMMEIEQESHENLAVEEASTGGENAPVGCENSPLDEGQDLGGLWTCFNVWQSPALKQLVV